MTAGTPSIHVVSTGNAWLMDNVDEDVFDNRVRPDLLQAFLANPANLLLVAHAEGQVVGMASAICYVHPDKPLSMFINEVGVAERFQRQGLGKRLVCALLEEARLRGCTEAWVATELSNTAARGLYEAVGGIPDQENAVVYVYDLGSNTAAHAGDA